jgi:hypothetical protein
MICGNLNDGILMISAFDPALFLICRLHNNI